MNLSPTSIKIALDERGKTLSSRELSGKIQDFQNESASEIQFIIGGANGLSDELRKECNFLLSFGRVTWPHMLARIMLIEQIYRSQQILSGHPYHRD